MIGVLATWNHLRVKNVRKRVKRKKKFACLGQGHKTTCTDTHRIEINTVKLTIPAVLVLQNNIFQPGRVINRYLMIC